eukprot:gene35436-45919_t
MLIRSFAASGSFYRLCSRLCGYPQCEQLQPPNCVMSSGYSLGPSPSLSPLTSSPPSVEPSLQPTTPSAEPTLIPSEPTIESTVFPTPTLDEQLGLWSGFLKG